MTEVSRTAFGRATDAESDVAVLGLTNRGGTPPGGSRRPRTTTPDRPVAGSPLARPDRVRGRRGRSGSPLARPDRVRGRRGRSEGSNENCALGPHEVGSGARSTGGTRARFGAWGAVVKPTLARSASRPARSAARGSGSVSAARSPPLGPACDPVRVTRGLGRHLGLHGGRENSSESRIGRWNR